MNDQRERTAVFVEGQAFTVKSEVVIIGGSELGKLHILWQILEEALKALTHSKLRHPANNMSDERFAGLPTGEGFAGLPTGGNIN